MWRLTDRRFWRVVAHYVVCNPCYRATGYCAYGTGLERELHAVWLKHRRDARLNPMRAGFLSAFDPTGAVLRRHFRERDKDRDVAP